ncbi:MAG: META domain-containing protein [Bacteroidota bacterium]
MKSICVLLLLSVIIFSCSPKLAPDSNWAEGKWLLIELKEVPVQISDNERRNAHLEFTPSLKTYEGFGGCNKISGTYSVEKSKIKFTSAPVLPSDCADISFENTFLSLLNEADKYEINGNTMTLKDGKKIILRFQRK